MLSRTEVFHGERTSEARTSGSGTRAVYWSSRENRTAVEIKTKVQSTLSLTLYAKPEVGLWDERNFFASVFASPHLRGQSSLLSGQRHGQRTGVTRFSYGFTFSLSHVTRTSTHRRGMRPIKIKPRRFSPIARVLRVFAVSGSARLFRVRTSVAVSRPLPPDTARGRADSTTATLRGRVRLTLRCDLIVRSYVHRPEPDAKMQMVQLQAKVSGREEGLSARSRKLLRPVRLT